MLTKTLFVVVLIAGVLGMIWLGWHVFFAMLPPIKIQIVNPGIGWCTCGK